MGLRDKEEPLKGNEEEVILEMGFENLEMGRVEIGGAEWIRWKESGDEQHEEEEDETSINGLFVFFL